MKKNVFLSFSFGILFLLNASCLFAMQETNTEIMLLQAAEYNTALDSAISLGDITKVQMFLNRLKAEDLNKLNKLGMTPLHYASWFGKYEIVSKLLNYEDIKINKKSKFDQTALHYVIGLVKRRQEAQYPELYHKAIDNYLKIATMLINYKKFDPNATNNEDQPLLHCAIEKSQWKVAKMLINHPKTDLAKRDGEGKAALELVEEQEHFSNNLACQEIAQMIRNRQKQATTINPATPTTNTNQNQINQGNSNSTDYQIRKENKKSSLFAGLFRLITSPFCFVGQKGIKLLSTLGALRNYIPAKSLFSWLFFLK